MITALEASIATRYIESAQKQINLTEFEFLCIFSYADIIIMIILFK